MRNYSKKSLKKRRGRSLTKKNRVKRKTRSRNLKKTLRRKNKQRGGNTYVTTKVTDSNTNSSSQNVVSARPHVAKENHIYSVSNSMGRNHYTAFL